MYIYSSTSIILYNSDSAYVCNHCPYHRNSDHCTIILAKYSLCMYALIMYILVTALRAVTIVYTLISILYGFTYLLIRACCLATSNIIILSNHNRLECNSVKFIGLQLLVGNQ